MSLITLPTTLKRFRSHEEADSCNRLSQRKKSVFPPDILLYHTSSLLWHNRRFQSLRFYNIMGRILRVTQAHFTNSAKELLLEFWPFPCIFLLTPALGEKGERNLTRTKHM